MFVNTVYASDSTIAITESDVSESTQSPEGQHASWTSFIPMILIFAVFYFFLIKPQEKKRKEQEALVNSVKRGEEVITSGGIYGKVSRVSDSDDTIEIEVAEGVYIKILKVAISDIASRKSSEAKNTKTGLGDTNKSSSNLKKSKK